MLQEGLTLSHEKSHCNRRRKRKTSFLGNYRTKRESTTKSKRNCKKKCWLMIWRGVWEERFEVGGLPRCQKLASSRRRRERSRHMEKTIITITATKIAITANLIAASNTPPTAIKLLKSVIAKRTSAERPARALRINAIIQSLLPNFRTQELLLKGMLLNSLRPN